MHGATIRVKICLLLFFDKIHGAVTGFKFLVKIKRTRRIFLNWNIVLFSFGIYRHVIVGKFPIKGICILCESCLIRFYHLYSHGGGTISPKLREFYSQIYGVLNLVTVVHTTQAYLHESLNFHVNRSKSTVCFVDRQV